MANNASVAPPDRPFSSPLASVGRAGLAVEFLAQQFVGGLEFDDLVDAGQVQAGLEETGDLA